MQEPIVTKGEFARLRNVSLRRVYQWIAAGQIGCEALAGARIKVDIATAHLRERLDPSQRCGMNGLSTRLDDAAPQAEHPGPPSVEARIKQEKLRQAELQTIRAEERDRLARGIYTLTDDVRRENRRLATMLFEAFDGALVDFAAALSARYKLPVRDALHILRAEMLKVRERVSSEYAALAASEPPTVQDDESRNAVLQ